jgi:hypothetical protein
MNESRQIELKREVKFKLLAAVPHRSKVAVSVSKCDANQSQVTQATAES